MKNPGHISTHKTLTYESNHESAFEEYLAHNDFKLSDRAYLLHIGKNMIAPVNEEYGRVSLPYKRSNMVLSFYQRKEFVFLIVNQNLVKICLI